LVKYLYSKSDGSLWVCGYDVGSIFKKIHKAIWTILLEMQKSNLPLTIEEKGFIVDKKTKDFS